MSSSYQQGQFFLLPLSRTEYAVGLIARVPRRGGVLLGYFFGPRRSKAPDEVTLNALTASQSVLACRFKDTALIRSEWPLLGLLARFDRSDWPVPAFHRFDGSTTYIPGNATSDWRVEYSDDNLIVPVDERPAEKTDLSLAEDIAYDPVLLAKEVGQRVRGMVPTIGD